MKARVYVSERRPGAWSLRAYLGTDSHGRPRLKTETHHGDTISAHARAKEIEAAIIRGELATTASGRLGDFLDLYLERLSAGGDLAASTLKGYREARARIPERLAGRELGKLKPRDFEALYLDLLRDSAPATVRNTHAFLHVALGYAETLGEVARNPVHGVRPPRPKKSRTAMADDDLDESTDDAMTIPREIALDVIASFDEPRGLQRRNPSMHALFLTAYATGARRGELCALAWRAIDLEAGTMTVRRSLYWPYGASEPIVKAPKTDAGRRTVTLSDRTVEALSRWRAELAEIAKAAGRPVPPLAFPDLDTFGPIRPDRISSAFRARMVALGHAGSVNVHALRHTHASELLAAREPVHVVSRRLGHSDVATTLRIYAHAIPGSDASVASRIDEILGL